MQGSMLSGLCFSFVKKAHKVVRFFDNKIQFALPFERNDCSVERVQFSSYNVAAFYLIFLHQENKLWDQRLKFFKIKKRDVFFTGLMGEFEIGLVRIVVKIVKIKNLLSMSK